ncbi:dipeptidyl aminopeptidase/acylaminoacyl peptidase [Tamaricihabitans halophyticus]|uniref:Dipeptidyl aminopeptidase/acylaminoacyl peptidase n=1 Tax=Tamaricihabitans halophyticus TaxID=1262583 RepID=A0A4R2R479_9PSEU|nr:prolyl oligopeptidase family serine peptidase [Tamaricihabitans halophyticus]TCP54185.1 dipeptidyl aminopeptidase/acylaminoacyl peptidase [Tamaricihabitans halophyticus]
MPTSQKLRHPAAEVPETLFVDDEAEQRWRARFHAARVSVPSWAITAPDRNVYSSNASGVWEIYAWDRAAGTHRRVTNRPNGTVHGTISPAGEWIWWFADTDGDEFGSWVREPFTGLAEGEQARPAVPGVPDGYPAGLDIGATVTAIGVSSDKGSTLYLYRDGRAEVSYEHEQDAGIGGLSRDERLLAISHSEHGDARHPALRVLSTVDNSVIAELDDGPGKGLVALGFSPVAGDSRLLVLHERRGREELLIWDPVNGTEQLIELDLPGELEADWYPDGSALLVVHCYRARNTLHTYHIADGTLTTVDTPKGTIGGATARPDGTVEYGWTAAHHPSVIRSTTSAGTSSVLLEPPGAKPPGSVPVDDAFVPGETGEVHALISRPEHASDGPLPTVFSLHGGPHHADEDRFSAYRAVWLDAGFAVVEVNYRGSTGYGSAWRDAIEGRPGLTELADVASVHDWALRSGLSDPDRCVVNGASWGGYLSLLALGTQPERWAAGIAAVPVADYVAAYEDEMEQLRSFDRALFGGDPDEVPEVYRECSPLTYVDNVRAPVLVLAGENDPRCPIRQVDNYLARLAERGADYEVYRYDAGHGSLVVAETVRQTSIEVRFAQRVLA